MWNGDPQNLDLHLLVSEGKHLQPNADLPEVRVAVCGDAATQQFVPVLKALLRRAGFNGLLYEAPFAGIELEAFDAGSALYRFQPNFIVLLNCTQALSLEYYHRTVCPSDFQTNVLERMERIWSTIESRTTALILQSNFVLPKERIFGNFDHKVPESLYSLTADLNARLAERARMHAGVVIHDVESIASWVGRREWFDDRFWFMAKTFCALEFLPLVAQNIVRIITASQGRIVKCVVLDLDNTLWGGVIGDDGINGIKLSAHGDGESFYQLQCFLRELSRRGILLAVCSKNDKNNAMAPFLHHPDMVLKLEDIAVFVANWDDKAQNIRSIQKTLNIGFDSMVFLDDNPFERNLVREFLPDVIVPELPDDPADYLATLSALNLFETTSFSSEDARRTELYRAEARSREELASFGSIDGFLESLEMRITVARWDGFHLPRIAQLFQRSNQFNLTTRRLSETQCAAMMEDDTCLPLYAELADRLSDHGLISLVSCRTKQNELVIEDWVMSCRVLSRGVEQYLMTKVFEHACANGCRRVIGSYLPTAKNGMVRDFYERFGFQKIADHDGGATWALSVAQYQPSPTYIRQVEMNAFAAQP
jgi:FkbH-like protein